MDEPFDFDDNPTVESDLGVYFLPKDRKPAMLEQVQGPGAPAAYPLHKVSLVIGRSQSADIRVDSGEVSRRHALLTKIGKEFMCEDQESRNGVYLNGVRIHSATLREGDTLQLGNAIFIYHEGS
ncbi:MAG: FHA domain-containing protein [Deltaproteobacteria bacterium]|nr:FHA domain-containing protein [Deltaproteobacteria bacterium]